MSTASTKALESLHAQLATVLAGAITKASTAEESKGLAAILNVARQFLKDNGIDSASPPGSPTAALAHEVAKHPFDPAADSSTH